MVLDIFCQHLGKIRYLEGFCTFQVPDQTTSPKNDGIGLTETLPVVYIPLCWQHIFNIQSIYMYLRMYVFVMFTCIGYKLPTFWEYMSIGEVSVRPSGAGLRNVHFLVCLLVLDINCQLLGSICQLEGFCAPLGRRVGKYGLADNCQRFSVRGDNCQILQLSTPKL